MLNNTNLPYISINAVGAVIEESSRVQLVVEDGIGSIPEQAIIDAVKSVMLAADRVTMVHVRRYAVEDTLLSSDEVPSADD